MVGELYIDGLQNYSIRLSRYKIIIIIIIIWDILDLHGYIIVVAGVKIIIARFEDILKSYLGFYCCTGKCVKS